MKLRNKKIKEIQTMEDQSKMSIHSDDNSLINDQSHGQLENATRA